MSYTAPTVTSAGLIIPSYIDIRDDLIAYFKSIYGQDCYLGEDSADYQWIAIVALRLYDALNSIQLAYNNRSPNTAIGSGLDQIVKMNGIARKEATYSTCEVVLTGDVGTVITSGVISDASGNSWSLPASVTLEAGSPPEEGTATVTATCQTIGAISALVGDLVTIATPTKGWTSVTNLVSATAGVAVESDAALRTRQTLSVTRPSMNLLTGTVSAIAALDNVTRYDVIENNTNEEDEHGNPPHSITCVVEGGDEDEIAETIWANRGLGCYVNGDVIKEVTDPTTGIETTIRFYRPEYVPIYVSVDVTSFSGYTTATTLAIQQAITDYLNGLQIGEDLTISALYAAAMAVTPDIYKPLFSISLLTAGKTESPQEAHDITIEFNQVCFGEIGNVTMTVI